MYHSKLIVEPDSLNYAEVAFSGSLNRQQQEHLQLQHQQQLQMMATLPRIGQIAVEYATIGFSTQSNSSTMSPSLSMSPHHSPVRSALKSSNNSGKQKQNRVSIQGSPKFESTVWLFNEVSGTVIWEPITKMKSCRTIWGALWVTTRNIIIFSTLFSTVFYKPSSLNFSLRTLLPMKLLFFTVSLTSSLHDHHYQLLPRHHPWTHKSIVLVSSSCTQRTKG